MADKDHALYLRQNTKVNIGKLSLGDADAFNIQLALKNGIHDANNEALQRRRLILNNIAWVLLLYIPGMTALIWSSTLTISLSKYSKINTVLFAVSQTMVCCYVAILGYNWRRPEYRCRLPWFLVHFSMGLLLFPLSNYLFTTRYFTSTQQPQTTVYALTFAFKIVGMNVLYTSLILRLRVMYLVYCKGIYDPRYTYMLFRMAVMIKVVTVIPIILEQTVPWCFENDLAYKGVQTLRVLFLIEIGFYVWQLGYAAQQFVDFQPIVRIFAAAVVLSICKLVLPRVGVFDAVGEMWFEVASTYWGTIVMMIEIFGFVMAKDVCIYFDWHLMDKVVVVSPAYNLLDPRGELDFILADNELRVFLLEISEQRFCSENCNFLRDVDLLGDISDKGNGVLKLQTVHAILHKYIYKGASTPVNLPGALIKSIQKIDINAD